MTSTTFRSLLREVLTAVDTGHVPDCLMFAVRPAQEHGWITACSTTLTNEGRRQLTRLTNRTETR